eukprot:12892537-Prorocentrum_lima.AAC.1
MAFHKGFKAGGCVKLSPPLPLTGSLVVAVVWYCRPQNSEGMLAREGGGSSRLGCEQKGASLQRA